MALRRFLQFQLYNLLFLACFCLLYGYSVIVFVPVCLQRGARLQAVPFVQPLSLTKIDNLI